MSKELMISIHPEWCGMIIGGLKELEIRKNKPTLEPPFKCHIYCTKDKQGGIVGLKKPDDSYIFSNGNVIADFVCDKIIPVSVPYPAYASEMNQEILKMSGLSYHALHRYAGHKTVYGLHISDLRVFDRSKKLTDYGISRAPQSWCYVNSDKGGNAL